MKRAILFSLGFALLSGVSGRAATRRVPSEYSRIQSAISDCDDGDVVVVEPDRYYELINFLGKDIVVTSTDPNDPEIVAETVIDGDGEGSVVTFENGESHEAVLTGFTITGGYGTVAADLTGEYIIWGTGIYCREASPTITKNVIRDNQGPVVVQNMEPVALSYGVGIGCVLSDAIVTGNTIRGNTGYAGAGIMSYVGSARISNNFIYHNSAAIGGGVIIIAGGWLTNNTIVGNDAGVQVPGGDSGLVGNVYVTGVAELGIQPLISNNIIAEAVSGGGILILDIPDEAIGYNNVWNNSPGNYLTQAPGTGEIIFDGEADRTGINGNISEDPRFFDPPDDYHLESGSPCISKGDPGFVPGPGETDIDGEPRVFAVRVDIGADEFVGYVKPVAFAGPDQHVAEPGLITLDGSGSYFDESAEQRDFMWSQEDGPLVELSDRKAMSPTFTPESEGLYLFELVVGDGTNLSEADDVIVLVGNKPPVANAGTNRICKVPERITLDGSASYDPDNIDDLTYSWRQVAGPSVVLHDSETAEPFFECNEEGAYVFELVVNDGFVDSQPSLVRVSSVVFTLNQQAVDAGYQADGYFHYVDVSGARVVYAVGMVPDDSWDIKCKNLETDEVESFSGGGIDTQPKIDGDIVVWSGGPFSSGVRDTECTSVFVRNIATGRQRTLRQHSDTASYSHPAVSGNKVVWLQHINIDKNFPDDWSNMPYDICGADITDINNPAYFTVAERVDNRDPYPVDSYAEDFDSVIDLSGHIVVWEAEGDIYGADISDLADIRTFQICIDGARQYDPAISGNVVVWTDERNDAGDIYGADISDIDNITEFQIAGAGGNQLQPAIDGCLVVYVQGTIYQGSIKAACLTRKNSVMDIELLNSPVGTGPAVDGQTVIWQTSAHGLVRAVSLELAYSISDGPVHNATSGRRYDYIQHAVNSADLGDRIIASPGIYPESVSFKDKNLDVLSSDPADPDVVASTIIRSSATVVTFSGVDANCLLAGFSITGGTQGIYCSGASPTIANCTIAGNRRSGMELRNGSKPAITNCSLVRNGAAGIEMWPLQVGRFTYYNYPVLTNCLIAENTGDGVLGGVPTITGCTVAANRQSGISALAPTVTSSVVFGNGPDSEGVQIKPGFGAVSFSDVQGSWPGTGNIDADPLFLRLGRWEDGNDVNAGGVWIPGDYHLLADSPCVDAGDPAYVPGPNETDLAGKTRLTGNTVDMGAFELGPVMGLSEQQLTFETELGMPNPPGQILYLRNIGGGAFDWEIAWDAGWLDVDQRKGSCQAVAGNLIRLRVDTAGLGPGLYECDMTISGPAAADSPKICRVRLVISENCFPNSPDYARQYADFLDYLANGAKPDCWCGIYGTPQWPFQCDGDADNAYETAFKYQIYTLDLQVLINNWKKTIDTADPCADFDHRAEGEFKYRVFTGDLAVVVTNWKKTASELPNNCPRPDNELK